jgi:Cu/Ag efflux protein CusF
MKRILILMVALLTLVAFAGGVMAQAPAKTEKPAATAPEKAAPAPEKSKPAAEKPKFGGTVMSYETGKMIKVKRSDGKEMTFNVTKKTELKGEVKEGALVTILYKKEGGKTVATAIIVASGKKPTKQIPEKATGKMPEKK